MATVTPALKGDGNGHYRILIVGNCGTGKTTLLRKLEKLLDIPALPLDKVRFKANWEPVPKAEYRELVAHFISSNRGWIIDGNSSSGVADLTQGGATDIIWLDPPALLYWPRFFRRTLLRILRLNSSGDLPEGCYETIGNVFFSSDSIIWWMLVGHWKRRRHYSERLQKDNAQDGGRVRRIGGWGRELREWWAAVEVLVKNSLQASSSG